MPYSVVKLGGSIFKGPSSAPDVARIVSLCQGSVAFVVSALRGVTDEILEFLTRNDDPGPLAASLADRYRAFAAAFSPPPEPARELAARMDRLEEGFIEAAAGDAPDRGERLLSYGERFAAVAFCAALAADDEARGVKRRGAARVAPGDDLPALFPEDLGLLAEPGPGGRRDAIAPDPAGCGARLLAALGRSGRLAVPGFYGLDAAGGVCLFGRGGSDYTATVLASAAEGGSCSLYKDAAGVRSADPALVPGTVHVPLLSYREAAALADGGARVLHAGAAREARRRRVPVRILPADGRSATVIGAGRRGASARPAPKCVSAASASGLATLSLVGEGVGRASECTAKALDALFAAKVKPLGIDYERSGVALRVSVAERDRLRALLAVHEEFFGKGCRS